MSRLTFTGLLEKVGPGGFPKTHKYASHDGSKTWTLELSRERSDDSIFFNVSADWVQSDAANDAQREFLAHISHEIRSPLNVIVGMTERAQNAPPHRKQHYLSRIQHNSDALLLLINDVLDFSKIEAGQMELSAVKTNFAEQVKQVSDAQSPRARQQGLEFVLEISPECNTSCTSDPTRFRQIVTNLVDNAIKYTDSGRVEVSLRHIQVPSGKSAELRVKDTGVGIPKHLHKLIFSKFYRTPQPLGRDAGGTGLGLAITQSLVKALAGDITVESSPDSGTTFTVVLPFIPVAVRPLVGRKVLVWHVVPEIDEGEFAELSGAGAEVEFTNKPKRVLSSFSTGKAPDLLLIHADIDPGSAKRIVQVIREFNPFHGLAVLWLGEGSVEGATSFSERICANTLQEHLQELSEQQSATPILQRSIRVLLVEDSPDNRTLLTHQLSGAGHQVTIARDGLQGLERYKEGPYDLVLMDVHMPTMDGLEATRRIRLYEDESGSRRCPIIAVTAHATDAIRTASQNAGMDDYVTKPIVAESLWRAIQKWVRTQPNVIVCTTYAQLGILCAEVCKTMGAAPIRVSDPLAATGTMRVSDAELILLDARTFADKHDVAARVIALAVRHQLPYVWIGTSPLGLPQMQQIPSEPTGADIGHVLRRHFSGESEPDLPMGMINKYLAQRQTDMIRLRTAISERDFELTRTIGHRLRGSGKSYGFQEISAIGEALEHASVEENLDLVIADVGRLARMLQAIEKRRFE